MVRKQSSPADREALADPVIYNMLLETWKENLHIDPRGYVDDTELLMHNWGFDPGSTRKRVHLVWGSEDTNVSPSVQTYFRDYIPVNELHILSNEGHFGFLRHWDLILKLISQKH